MSVEREFRWTCDGCGRQTLKSSYGLPQGWTWEATGVEGVRHTCGGCHEGKPEVRRLTDEEVEQVFRSVTCAGINAPGEHPAWRMRLDWLRARRSES